jgi:hypothetical protein
MPDKNKLFGGIMKINTEDLAAIYVDGNLVSIDALEAGELVELEASDVLSKEDVEKLTDEGFLLFCDRTGKQITV